MRDSGRPEPNLSFAFARQAAQVVQDLRPTGRAVSEVLSPALSDSAKTAAIATSRRPAIIDAANVEARREWAVIMIFDWNPDAGDQDSVRAWLAAWQPCVQTSDFAAARPRFADNVASFGTHMTVVSGIDALETTQWRRVWPMIDDFAWDFDGMQIGVSPDRLMAVLITTWTSTGYHEDGSAFDRPGRTTVVLARSDIAAPWRGIHTHFSLHPGTPHRSYGRPPETS